jgi:cobaltochelatase CobN
MSHQTADGQKRFALLLPRLATLDDSAVADLLVTLKQQLSMLQTAGYKIDAIPVDAKALRQRLRAAAAGNPAAQTLSFADYQLWFAMLPQTLQQKTIDHYGPAETDPAYRPGELDCGRFVIPVLWFGDIVIGQWPVRAGSAGPDTLLSHGDLALSLWLRQEAAVDVLIDLANPQETAHPCTIQLEMSRL